MARVTSKHQVTVPKVIAEQYGIHPGDDIQWIPAGDVIRVVPAGKSSGAGDRDLKLQLFDQATQRQRKRSRAVKAKPTPNQSRGWAREDLYTRGRTR
ncbi:MAG: AbrB/MazE/SpoVT family DNA-binding domain-containing protein [Candidatus Acidiferrales bacterium]